jgi:adenine-specific DNA-methyltransferase
MATKDYSLLSREDLVSLLLKYDEKKKYGIVWDEERVPEKVVTDCLTHLPVLTEVKDKEIITNPSDLTHLLIEGDNYHTLSVLNYTHQGKIDLIYIDPPYNTGNKDFIYNDKYVDTVDTYRHSKWLNFMNKRLELARELLSERGSIFISIDENEFAQLKMLCDKIFGEENFVIDIIWNSRKSVSNDTIISLNHNHTLFYCRDIKYLQKNKTKYRLNTTSEKFTNIDNDERGLWVADPFDAPQIRKNLEYAITNPNTGQVFFPPKGRHWRTTEEEYNKYLNDGRIVFGKNGKSKPQLKRFFTEAEKSGTVPKSIWDDVGTTTNGTQELEKIFGEKIFNNPKPTSLIKRIIEIASFKDSIILDFFAGSGTTGQAVVEYNKFDNGNRQFILATNNENNNGHGKILDDVCYPRIKKVFKGFQNTKNEKIDGLGNNLKYFKTSFVENLRNKDQVRNDITRRCTEMLCVKEGIYNLYKEGTDWKIFNFNEKYLAVFYDFSGLRLNKLRDEMNEITGEKVLYCFSSFSKLDSRDFTDWNNIRLEAVPEPILLVYNKIF